MRSYLARTLGCRLNVAESTKVEQELIRLGWRHDDKKPDLVVINSCSVTHKADKESRQLIRLMKRKYPKAKLVVTGCMAGFDQLSQEARKMSRLVDLWVVNKDKDELVQCALDEFSQVFRCFKDMYPQDIGNNKVQTKFERSGKRFIKIQDGCDKFCYYCVTILRRGRSRSKPVNEILGEVMKAEKEGMKQVILTGVDIADFKPSLGSLVEQILLKTKKVKIGVGSVNLAGFDKKLIGVWSKNQKRMINYFHISLQSGCNQTLKRMNRRHTVEEFNRLVIKLRKNIKGVKIGTDVIVGYPGETEEEFETSLRNIKKIGFDRLHVFRYSKRQGTVAEKKEKEWGRVRESDKTRRAKKVRELV